MSGKAFFLSGVLRSRKLFWFPSCGISETVLEEQTVRLLSCAAEEFLFSARIVDPTATEVEPAPGRPSPECAIRGTFVTCCVEERCVLIRLLSAHVPKALSFEKGLPERPPVHVRRGSWFRGALHFGLKGTKTLLQKPEKLCAAFPLGDVRRKYRGIERLTVAEADLPRTGNLHGGSHGLEGTLHEEGKDGHAHLQGEKRHSSFEGLELSVQGALSLGKDENPFAFGKKSEEEFEDCRRALVVLLRDGDRSQMGNEPLQNGPSKKIVPGHVGEPVGKDGAYDEGIEVTAVVTGEEERLSGRNPVALFHLEPVVDGEDETAEPFHQEIEHCGKPPDEKNVFGRRFFF
jgi:hypothetical protein